MAQPRFLFVARVRARSDSWTRWQAGHGAVPEGERPATSWVAWRLVGANNRELGRSSQTFADLVECTYSLGRLRLCLADAQPTISVDASSGCWYWRLDFEGKPIASAGRAYQRQRECVYSLEQFQRAVPTAVAVMQTLIDLREATEAIDLLPFPRHSLDAAVLDPAGFDSAGLEPAGLNPAGLAGSTPV